LPVAKTTEQNARQVDSTAGMIAVVETIEGAVVIAEAAAEPDVVAITVAAVEEDNSA
jgi:hypothetical protein